MGGICGGECGVCSRHGGGYFKDICTSTGIIPLAIFADASTLEGPLRDHKFSNARNIVDSAKLVDGHLCEIGSYSESG